MRIKHWFPLVSMVLLLGCPAWAQSQEEVLIGKVLLNLNNRVTALENKPSSAPTDPQSAVSAGQFQQSQVDVANLRQQLSNLQQQLQQMRSELDGLKQQLTSVLNTTIPTNINGMPYNYNMGTPNR